MFIEDVLTSWAGHQIMRGFPLLPKRLPTEESYRQGRDVIETRWFRSVTWARIAEPQNPETGECIWKDAFWVN